MFNLNKLKSREEKFSYLNSLAYSVQLKKKGTKFYLIIPELSLISVNENLDAAYRDLNTQKENIFNRILDCEAEDEIIIPVQVRRMSETKTVLKVFVYKILIVSILFGGSFAFIGAVLINKLSNIPYSSIAMKAVQGIVREFEKITNTPQEIKEIRVKKFRQLLDEARPYLYEYQRVMSPCIEKEKFDDGKKEGEDE